MPELTNNGMQCHEFDGLLADALDGLLSGSTLDRFQAHARACPACGPLFAEAQAGRSWLKELTEVEPPVSLVDNILASTRGVDTQRLRVHVATQRPGISALERVQAWLSNAIQPVWDTVRQPRFAMSFGMAFFSLSVALSVAGVKPSELRQISLRPTAIRHTYYNAQARVVRYYQNIRFVYAFEASVRGLKRNLTPAEPGLDRSGPAKPQPKERKNDTTQKPEQKQERNYSQFDTRIILACTPLGPSVDDLPVVSVTTYRRFVI
jgi:predicted RNA-binding Zn ribbon-like protein